LGRFPPGWLEWNDRYRDDVRRFWRGDAHTAGSLATRICGSSDIFAGEKSRSVNFLAAHDGFSLADLVTYESKHNSNNGEGNRDGQDENFSWNNGVEGPSADPDVASRRQADVRALLATLFASKGSLLLTAGDEFGRSQGGNNNAYAQDNAVTWLDWINRDTALEDFVAGLAAFRASSPGLQDVNFLKQASWYQLDGKAMESGSWDNTAGFEVHMTGPDGTIIIRVDSQARQCTARRA
jgi:glycogen operon protein